jgi:Holliday junction resolvasome RuvABC DNA-binding subunit
MTHIMSEQEKQYSELVDWLSELGHSDTEIQKIVARVQRYEQEMQTDSIMDSIGSGSLDLSSLIEEALAD